MTDTLVQPAAVAPQVRPRSRPAWPGILSFCLAVLTVAGLITGIVLATGDRFAVATYAAWAAVGVSALAVLAGVVALALRRARGWAIAGIVLAVVANPVLLTPALTAIGGLWA